MRLLASVVAGTLLCASTLVLLAEDAPQSGLAPSETNDGCRPCRGHWSLTYGAGWGDPLGRYASVGVALGDVRYVGPVVGMGLFRAALLQADLGSGGWSASVGTPIPLLAKAPRRWEPLGVPMAAVAAKLTLLHTRGQPVDTPPGQTYVGASLEIVMLAHVRLGALAHVSGSGPARPLWTWGVGLGF